MASALFAIISLVKIMNIAIYCGSCSGNKEIHEEKVKELITYLANQGHSIIYGGSDIGIMGVVASTAISCGAEVTGVELEMFNNMGLSKAGLAHYYVAKTFAERRNKMIELADAFIALPGGIGTLDEISEVICYAPLYFPDKKIILYNIDHFYDLLNDFFIHMRDEGFLKDSTYNKCHFLSSLDEFKEFF